MPLSSAASGDPSSRQLPVSFLRLLPQLRDALDEPRGASSPSGDSCAIDVPSRESLRTPELEGTPNLLGPAPPWSRVRISPPKPP